MDMEQRNLEKAMDIYARLMMGEEIRSDSGANRGLYEEYAQNAEVYEILEQLVKRLNLHLYEYDKGLYLTAGDGNRVFGYSNEELRRSMGLRANKELYLTYFIMYQVILTFYKDTGSYQFVEYTSLPELLERTTNAFKTILMDMDVLVQDEMEEHSFSTLALLWDELPLNPSEDAQGYRAGRGSRTGMVKLTLNFLKEQDLLMEAQEQYYPTSRLKALVENYFEDNRGRLYEILKAVQKGEDEYATDEPDSRE
jgi:hypothetical protein